MHSYHISHFVVPPYSIHQWKGTSTGPTLTRLFLFLWCVILSRHINVSGTGRNVSGVAALLAFKVTAELKNGPPTKIQWCCGCRLTLMKA